MRIHEDDAEAPRRESPARTRPGTGTEAAQRAISEGSLGALAAESVLGLQRTAGNQAVDGLLNDEASERSPVLDVVGKGGGQPLDPGVRGEMEGLLGHDFGDVRVHTDTSAAASAKAVQAQAYTVGNEVVFESGRYAPETDEGRRTLAHELTHVVQQRSGPVEGTAAPGGISLSDPGDRFERAASEVADQVGGQPVQRQLGTEEEEEEIQSQ